MDFIFMLTREDATVEDCLDVLASIKPLGLKHIGFKDVGVDGDTLYELNRRIRVTGAKTYMEVVSTTHAECMASVRTAVEVGVDCLLGGTAVEEVLETIRGTGIEYFPFPGRPEGHPTRLGGDARRIAEDCTRFLDQGCAGVDLLAYRATEAQPIELVRAARKALGGAGRLIVAGSVDSAATVRELDEAGVDAFTIGSAVFEGAFSPRKGLVRSQLNDVLTACT